MGLFTSRFFVWNPAKPEQTEEIEALVDTGASYSWLHRERLERLGIRSTGRMQFKTIEGKIVEREVAALFVRADGRVGGDTVVVAEASDAEVLGAHTLECLGLAADPVQKRLIPTVGMAMWSAFAVRDRKNIWS